MIIFKRVAALQNYLHKCRTGKVSIGFVPTMGALHKGHISLLEKSKEMADKTVCSIFVNPAQFNSPEDFDKYPVNIEQDVYLLQQTKCDVLFLPGLSDMYINENLDEEVFDLGYLESMLEGKYRPGHFQGVCKAVKRLLQIVEPSFLFAGQKDYQQCMVLLKLLQILNSETILIICPTIRQKNGLALSSRNLRLNNDEKTLAPEIYKTLSLIAQQIMPGNLHQLKATAVNSLNEKGFKTDYVEIAKAENLEIIDEWNGIHPLVILAAAHLNNIRLIDNLTHTAFYS